MSAARLPTALGLALVAAAVLAVAVAPAASAVTIESIRAGTQVTTTSASVFTDNSSGFDIRCRHDITIPTSAFTGTSSVSIEAANNVYSNCRDFRGAACVVRALGRWTITAPTTTSPTLRLDSGVSIDCTSRVGTRYSCVFSIPSAQSLTMTFTNPVSPATTGTMRIDSPNTLAYTITASTSCVFGPAGTRGNFTLAETISTENLRIR